MTVEVYKRSSRSTTHKPFILHKPARVSAYAVEVRKGIFDEFSSMLEGTQEKSSSVSEIRT